MKEIRWELILMPLVSIVLGIYLIMQPGAATVALCSLIGWLILLAGAAGAVNSVTFQRATFMTSPLLPVSVAVSLMFAHPDPKENNRLMQLPIKPMLW